MSARDWEDVPDGGGWEDMPQQEGYGRTMTNLAGNMLAFGPAGPLVSAGGMIDPDLKDIGSRALQAAPRSGWNLLKNTAYAVRHLDETIPAIGKLGAAFMAQGVDPEMEAAAQRASPETQKAWTEAREAYAKEQKPLVDETLKALGNRYGGYGAIKNTVATDPIVMASDISMFLPGANLLNAGVRAAGGAVRAAEPIASHVLGVTTGAGADSIRAAGRAGLEGNQTFVNQMRGAGDMNQPVDLARGAVRDMRAERNATYNRDMAGVRSDKAVLDMDPVVNALANSAEIGSYKGVSLSNSASATHGALTDLISKWKSLDPAEFHTPEGLDALKKAVGEIRTDTLPHTQGRLIADQVYNAVKDTIVQQAPAYAKTMADYQKANEGINEAVRTMSLGEKSSKDAALRKLQSVMRDTVASNFQGRKKVGEVLAQYAPDLPYAIAGQTLNGYMPRGLTARGMAGAELLGHAGALATGHLGMVPMLAASSPRLVGEAVYGAGRALSPLARAWNAVSPTASLLSPGVTTAGQLNQIPGLLAQ